MAIEKSIFKYLLVILMMNPTVLVAGVNSISAECENEVIGKGLIQNASAYSSRGRGSRSWSWRKILKSARKDYSPCVKQAFDQAKKDTSDYWGHIAKKYKCFVVQNKNPLTTSLEESNLKNCKRRKRSGKKVDLWKSVTENLAYIKSRSNLFEIIEHKHTKVSIVSEKSIEGGDEADCDNEITGTPTKIPAEKILKAVETLPSPWEGAKEVPPMDCERALENLCHDKKNKRVQEIKNSKRNLWGKFLKNANLSEVERHLQDLQKSCEKDMQSANEKLFKDNGVVFTSYTELLKKNPKIMRGTTRIRDSFGSCRFKKTRRGQKDEYNCYLLPNRYKKERNECFEKKNRALIQKLKNFKVKRPRKSFRPKGSLETAQERLDRLLLEVKANLSEVFKLKGLEKEHPVFRELEKIKDIAVASESKFLLSQSLSFNAFSGSENGKPFIRVAGMIVLPDNTLKQILSHEIGHNLYHFLSEKGEDHKMSSNLKCLKKSLPFYPENFLKEMVPDQLGVLSVLNKMKKINSIKNKRSFFQESYGWMCANFSAALSPEATKEKRERKVARNVYCHRERSFRKRACGDREKGYFCKNKNAIGQECLEDQKVSCEKKVDENYACSNHPLKEDRLKGIVLSNTQMRKELGCKKKTSPIKGCALLK